MTPLDLQQTSLLIKRCQKTDEAVHNLREELGLQYRAEVPRVILNKLPLDIAVGCIYEMIRLDYFLEEVIKNLRI